jgi:hypothetical protein
MGGILAPAPPRREPFRRPCAGATLPRMSRTLSCVALAVLAACGGGGGGGNPPPPVNAALALAAADAEIGTGATTTELLVRLVAAPTVAPCLLEAAFELPPQLTMPANDRLAAAVPLVDLDGELDGARFRVLCGDAHNANASPLAVGPLFRLRVQAASPRVPGTYTVALRQVRAATREGVEVPVETAPTLATVIVR